MRPAPNPDRWADLRLRVISAVVMVAVGVVAIGLGGAVFAALVVVCCGLMIWELARMTHATGADIAVPLGLSAGLCLALVLGGQARWMVLLLALPALIGAAGPRRIRVVFAGYALLVMLTGYGMVQLRNGPGLVVIVWLVAVVVASDLAGYFAGRALGGPKFWPAISPKKTWSGTVAGWIGAALVGLGFVAAGQGGWGLMVLSPLVALAGQMGDIVESGVKRRVGVKDSSGLIPGHGGLMDRFDALAGAAVIIYFVSLVVALPIGGP